MTSMTLRPVRRNYTSGLCAYRRLTAVSDMITTPDARLSITAPETY
jgi:hypothetical protein